MIRSGRTTRSSDRVWPGLGFFVDVDVDVDDALARRGAALPGIERRSGERFRQLPLIVTLLMLRPGEGVADRAEHSTDGCYEVTPLLGGHLKHRKPDETLQLEAPGWSAD